MSKREEAIANIKDAIFKLIMDSEEESFDSKEVQRKLFKVLHFLES